MATVLASTTSGLLTFDLEGSPGRSALEGRHVRAIAPEAWQRLWAVVDGRDIWRTEGDGWERVVSLADLAGAEDLEALCLADTRANPLGGILVGTSRARLVRVTDARDACGPFVSRAGVCKRSRRGHPPLERRRDHMDPEH